VYGVVAPDGTHAVFTYAQLDTATTVEPAPIRLPGLHPDRAYTISVVGGPAGELALPSWAGDGGVRTVPGRLLSDVGIRAPALRPGTAVVLELRAT
jgi:alpha-galactosidase